MVESTTDVAVPQASKPKTSNTTKIVLAGLGLILLTALTAVFAWGLQTHESVQLNGQKAPAFALTTFEGEEVTLDELRGQVVVVNFWASWCVECYKEAALLEQAHQDYRDRGVVFLGIDYLDTEKEALAYMAQYGITYPSGQDLGTKIATDYMITGVPETFFIDKDGYIEHVQIGPIERPQLHQLLDRLIAEGA